MSNIEQVYTNRGFRRTKIMFSDYRGTPEREFSVQESSIAPERKVWVGAEPMTITEGYPEPWTLTRAHLNEDEARAVRDALTEWLEAGE